MAVFDWRSIEHAYVMQWSGLRWVRWYTLELGSVDWQACRERSR